MKLTKTISQVSNRAFRCRIAEYGESRLFRSLVHTYDRNELAYAASQQAGREKTIDVFKAVHEGCGECGRTRAPIQ
jgi:hypothetical protein